MVAPLKVGIAGLGTVGAEVVRLIESQGKSLSGRCGRGVRVTAVTARSQAKKRGLGVIFISHNPQHAYAVGDRFIILKRGRAIGNWSKDELSQDAMVRHMSGADELEILAQELRDILQKD